MAQGARKQANQVIKAGKLCIGAHFSLKRLAKIQDIISLFRSLLCVRACVRLRVCVNM